MITADHLITFKRFFEEELTRAIVAGGVVGIEMQSVTDSDQDTFRTLFDNKVTQYLNELTTGLELANHEQLSPEHGLAYVIISLLAENKVDTNMTPIELSRRTAQYLLQNPGE